MTSASDHLWIWQAFVSSLRQNTLTEDRVQPYHAAMKEPMLGFLSAIREVVDQLEVTPEIHPVGNQVHFVVPLSTGTREETFCFTFLVERSDWKLQHLESIVIRLDEIGALPCSVFPDLPEDKKAWMREEIRVTEQVRLYNHLAETEGKDFAYQWFRDGDGYALAARTWVPFVPAHRAFILYLCWEQAHLRGSRVVLRELEEQQAVVELQPIYLRLYRQTGHLRSQIGEGDYRRLFQAIWQDRARAAGWGLDLSYEDDACVLRFELRRA
jgi:hypothetical protein